MLSERFPIRYKRPDRTPIQLFPSGNNLLISVNLEFSQQAKILCPEGWPQTYAELVVEGIRRFWSGSFLLPLPDENLSINVEVQITCSPRRRAAHVRVKRMFFKPPHVRSPWYRFFWGLPCTGQLESIGTNWSLEQPGIMILPMMQNPEQIQRIAAHEAGHLFGIGDAYAAIYRFYHAVPGTEHYMMHSNNTVQAREILMMLQAHSANRMQFFPRHFNWKHFCKGLATDFRQRLQATEQQLELFRQQRKQKKKTVKDAAETETAKQASDSTEMSDS